MTNGLEIEARILQNIPAYAEDIRALLTRIRDVWGEEDKIYRFYHESFKVYDLQQYTVEMFELIRTIGDVKASELNPLFMQIIREGTDKHFDTSHNSRWGYETRPILEAFWHTKHMLEMMLTYGFSEEPSETVLSSGWATVLSIYRIRY